MVGPARPGRLVDTLCRKAEDERGSRHGRSRPQESGASVQCTRRRRARDFESAYDSVSDRWSLTKLTKAKIGSVKRPKGAHPHEVRVE
jgi:hypothetical protein